MISFTKQRRAFEAGRRSTENNKSIRLMTQFCDSEALMWLMAGANHPELHLEALRPIYNEYRETGGGYGNE